MVEIGAYEQQERLQGIPNGHDRIREGVTAGGLDWVSAVVGL